VSLLTDKQKERLPKLYTQENCKDPLVYVHIICLKSFWLLLEYDKETNTAFGYCQIIKGCGELGYFSLDEIDELPYPKTILEVEKPLSIIISSL